MAKYTMRISRNTIDKLGVKLYDKTADVISELISNAYDADAEEVTVHVPINVFLASKKKDKVADRGYTIVIEDDGHGMGTNDANLFYLKIGTDRRTDKNRKSWGKRSPKKKRPVMGRKGIGKLSAFGICKLIEVWSAGGKKKNGKYQIVNFILNFDKIIKDTDADYEPTIGKDDGKYTAKQGTKIILSKFLFRGIPDKETFMRQVSRKFALGVPDFTIKIHDIKENKTYQVTEMDLPIIQRTKVDLNKEKVSVNSKKYPIKGWIAYSDSPYSNEEMAGVRIYARGKLAAVTRDFGQKAGFTGEHTLRSYLIGAIHADWLDDDEDEDLNATDRQDILWSSEKGSAFKLWGQKVIKKLASDSSGPLREKNYESFLKKSNFEKVARKRFGNTKVFDAAMSLSKTLGSRADRGSLNDSDYVTSLLELILAIAPHTMIVDKLKEITKKGNKNALEVVGSLFGDAKLAEIASLGQIALERINAIQSLEEAIRNKPVPQERVLQKMLENAPWLVEPEWTVLQTNQTFENFRGAFEMWYYKQTKQKIITKFDRKNESKTPDFIMIQSGRSIEIIEIKRPEHVFDDEDFGRLFNYIEKMKKCREMNPSISDMLPKTHFTLICDEIGLTSINRKAFDSFVEEGVITKKTWEEVLNDTKQAHEDFIKQRNTLLKESSS